MLYLKSLFVEVDLFVLFLNFFRRGGAMLKILVVDDDQAVAGTTVEMCEAVLLMLGFAEFKILTASNGIEALALINGRPPMLVISDLNMPGMNGEELLDAIRKLDPVARVMIVTGDTPQEVMDHLRQKGAWEVYPKPFGVPEVKAVITRLKEELEKG